MNNNRKIAIVSASLGTGGAERFAGLLSFMLTKLGFEVYHIIIEDQVDYEFSGQLYNLGILGKEKTGWRRKLRKGKLLKRYLDDNQIDCIIDNRSRNHFMRELFAQWSYGNRKKYVIVHSYHLENYFPKSTFLAKLLYKKASKIISRAPPLRYGERMIDAELIRAARGILDWTQRDLAENRLLQ